MSAPSLAAQIQGQASVSADNLNTYEQTCDSFSQLRAFIGLPGIQVFARGIVVPSDGGQGVFYWNASATATDDNLNVIVPTGSATGAWIRIPLTFNTNSAIIYSSAYSTLAAADAAATAVNGILAIDRNWVLTANFTFSSPVVSFIGGVITRAAYTITFSGRVEGLDYVQMFDASGSGLVTFNKNGRISAMWMGAAGNGVADDTNASRQTIIAAGTAAARLTANTNISPIIQGAETGATAYFPGGAYLWTGAVTSTYSYLSIIGDGHLATKIIFRPGAAASALVIRNGSQAVVQPRVSGFAFWSDDVTNTKVALDVYDISVGQITDIQISGSYSGPLANYWYGNGSIGIRTHGRDQTEVRTLEIQAEYPLYFAANPNTSPDDLEDMDHWSWNDCYLLAYGHYNVTVQDGLGLGNVDFEGYQAWVGGTGGFYINDTRSAGGALTSHSISFRNIRCEQFTVQTNYAFQFTFTKPVETLLIENTLTGDSSYGINIDHFYNLTLVNYTGSQQGGHICLNVTGAASQSVLAMVGCFWQSGGVVNTTNMVISQASAWNTVAFSAPSNATYVSAPGVNLDFRYSGVLQNNVATLKWVLTLANNNTQDLSANTTGQGVVSVIARACGVGGGVLEGGMIVGADTTTTLVSGTSNFQASTGANKLSLYLDGSSNLILDNKTGQSLQIEVVAEAQM